MSSEYRRGVEDALTPMLESNSLYNDPQYGRLSTFEFVNTVLADRRKSLLTEKVTKWVNVYALGTKIYVAPITFDTEQEAKGVAPSLGVPSEIFGKPVGTYQKSVPIEIEVPID